MESSEEFEFNSGTDRGYCNLCKVDLTSAAHAQQHLQGKRHAKEKKKQRTISAFSRSASSGSVSATGEETRGAEGMSNETSRIGSTGFSAGMLGKRDVHDAPLIDFSESTDQAAAAGAFAAAIGGPGGDAGGTGKTMTSGNPDEEIFRDQTGQVWYKCVPCNVPLNTLEQLRIHQQSPKHLKNAAKPKPSLVTFPMATPGRNTNDASASGQSRLMTDGGGDVTDAAQNDTVFINGQIWYRCHDCNCDVNTRDQLRKHQQSPKHKKAAERAVLARTGNAGSGSTGAMHGLGMDRTIWHTCQFCKKKLNSPEQLNTHMRSHGRGAGSMAINSPPGPAVSNRTIESLPGPAVGNRTIESPPGPAVGNRISDSSSGTASGLSFAQFLPFKGKIDDIQVVRAGTPLKQHFMEEEKWRNSSFGGLEQAPGREEREESLGGSEASPTRGEQSRQRDRTPDGSEASPGRQSLSPGISTIKVAAAQPGDVDAARKKEEEEIDGVIVRLDDTDELSSGYHGNSRRVVTDGGAGAATDNLADQMESLTLNSIDPTRNPGPAAPPDPDDPIRAPCLYEPCFYHCGVCDTHLGGPSPKIDHMASIKHLKNLKRKGMLGVGAASPGGGGGGGSSLMSDGLIRIIQKPKSPNTPEGYYNYCDICRVAFSGPEAQAAHERGKQHKARAAKSSAAPVRNLPGIVKQPYGGDTTDSYVLTKTEPRGYQVELYMKAMAADSVIFLPTGE